MTAIELVEHLMEAIDNGIIPEDAELCASDGLEDGPIDSFYEISPGRWNARIEEY